MIVLSPVLPPWSAHKIVSSPETFCMLLFLVKPSTHPEPLVTTDLFSVPRVLLSLGHHILEVIQCIIFWVWLPRLSTMPLVNSSFLLVVRKCWMIITLFIQLPIQGQFDYFPFLAIMNSFYKYSCSFHVIKNFNFPRIVFRIKTAGSYCKCKLNFTKIARFSRGAILFCITTSDAASCLCQSLVLSV